MTEPEQTPPPDRAGQPDDDHLQHDIPGNVLQACLDEAAEPAETPDPS